ncbi:hypothetical protein HMPREF9080_03071 [Cardiobacterium valvarum F0432]|uniref:Uncharacterized protein n=1 Tax=Cardiobacterium valvarum F0432 TaxID=797473 RepID=G9ZJU9_9GAMM|nr:hypothetical protein HMPREF9080_03071 [Cardiobacterium valvarum F0432]
MVRRPANEKGLQCSPFCRYAVSAYANPGNKVRRSRGEDSMFNTARRANTLRLFSGGWY